MSAHSPDTLRIQALRETLAATDARIVASAQRIKALPSNVVPLRGATGVSGPLTRSVLVVEDDAEQRAILRAALGLTLGVAVYAVGTANEAVAALREHRCAVVVLDWYLANDTAEAFLDGLPRRVGVIVNSGASAEVLAWVRDTFGATTHAKGDNAGLTEGVRAALDRALAPRVG